MGIKAKLVTLDGGYSSQSEYMKHLVDKGTLVVNGYYEVMLIDVYSSSTNVWLECIGPDKCFNSIFFEFYDEETGEEIDVYDEEISANYPNIHEYY